MSCWPDHICRLAIKNDSSAILRSGQRFVMRADEKLTFMELEAAIRESGLRNESERPIGPRFGGCKWQTIPPSL